MNNDKRKGILQRFSVEIGFLLFSIISAMFAYFLVKELMFSIGILLIYLVFSTLFIIPLAKKNRRIKTRSDEVSSFLLNFVSFFQQKTLQDSFSSAILSLKNPSLNLIIERSSSLSFLEQVDYFEEYFSSPYYCSFCHLLSFNPQPKQKLLIVMEPLVNEACKARDKLFREDEIKKKNWAGLCFCWLISFLLIAFLRFALMNLFSINSLKEFSLILYSSYFGLLLCSVTFFSFCVYGDSEVKKNERESK